MKVAIRMMVVAILAMALGLGASAQLSKGFRGKVLDRDGKPAAGVVVTIVDEANAENHYEIKTEASGTYTYTGLPYSDKGYRITVQLPDLPAVSKIEKPKLMDIVDVNFDMRKDLVIKEAKANPAADAKQLFELGDMEGALAKAEEAIKSGDKDNVKPASLIRATCLEKLGRTDEALAAFEDYNKSYPGELSVLGELATLYEKKGDKAKADDYKKQFIAKGGTVTGQTYNDGVNAYNNGDFPKSVDLFRKAIQENPQDPDAHRELARALVGEQKYAEAITELQTYLKMKPNAEDAEIWKQAIAGLEPMAHPEGHKK